MRSTSATITYLGKAGPTMSNAQTLPPLSGFRVSRPLYLLLVVTFIHPADNHCAGVTDQDRRPGYAGKTSRYAWDVLHRLHPTATICQLGPTLALNPPPPTMPATNAWPRVTHHAENLGKLESLEHLLLQGNQISTFEDLNLPLL
eukprot:1184614-Prorocentrum_minimum.AAC.1